MDKVEPWSNYFMSLAKKTAERSKDPSTKVGAVIVNKKNQIVGTGYNGMPKKVDETPQLWEKETKGNFVIHAEVNAILNSIIPVEDCIIYSTLFPCNNCLKLIIAAGIREICYSTVREKELTDESKQLIELAGITIRKI